MFPLISMNQNLKVCLFFAHQTPLQVGYTVRIGTFGAAIERISYNNAVIQQFTTAMLTAWSKGAHRTFEAIKDMSFPTQMDFKALSLTVSTYFTIDVLLQWNLSRHKSPHHKVGSSFWISVLWVEVGFVVLQLQPIVHIIVLYVWQFVLS